MMCIIQTTTLNVIVLVWGRGGDIMTRNRYKENMDINLILSHRLTYLHTYCQIYPPPVGLPTSGSRPP